ncbi:hypothetical protein L7F22_063360 [Adiantum nelumboides]|nr:hypothetical protein [Adiantum nelumboides]
MGSTGLGSARLPPFLLRFVSPVIATTWCWLLALQVGKIVLGYAHPAHPAVNCSVAINCANMGAAAILDCDSVGWIAAAFKQRPPAY